jgi:phosphoglycerate dehydrogenase-like enzyme
MALLLVDPHPRTLDQICDAPTRARLETLGELVVHEGGRMPGAMVERHLPDAVAVLGQTDLGPERLAHAPRLRAIVNVEGNLLENVDYATCAQRGIHVLVASAAFAPAVAEAALGMALDLARGLSAADRAMRAGVEAYGLEGNRGAFLLTGADVGIVGLGDVGRALLALLAPWRCRVRAYDPWLPDVVVRAAGAEPAADLDALLGASRVVFVLAAATTENEGMLGRAQLERLPPGAVVVLASRAAVADVDALVELAAAGRLRAAIDVWPQEPVPRDHPARGTEGLLLSAHRAGAVPAALRAIGALAVADLELVLRGLPPVACRRAERETAGRLRSRPVERT